MNTNLIQLQLISDLLLADGEDYAALRNALQQYKELLTQIAGIDIGSDASREDILLDTGKAIGTAWAVLCIDDMMRTRGFIKGTFEAVNDMLKTNNNVQLLYAGCGPFASLLLPTLARIPPAKLQCHLLEINPQSLESVKKIITAFGLEEHIKSVESTDAVSYKIPSNTSFDIVLTETMQHGLAKEQQVPITANLMRQLGNEAVLIPGSISLQLCLFNSRRFLQWIMGEPVTDYSTVLGEFFELSKETVHNSSLKDFDETPIWKSSESIFELGAVDTNDFHRLCVLTNIEIYGNQRLSINQSGLTIPYALEDLHNHRAPATAVKVRYRISNKPGIEYDIIR